MYIVLKLDGEGAWPDLPDKEVIHFGNDAPPLQITCIESGMTSGKHSVAMRLDLPDGRVVIFETSWTLFSMAYHGLLGKLGEAE